MRTWKIFTIAAFALVATALFTASAYAYMGRTGATGTYVPNAGGAGTYGFGGGMMGGGMMGGYPYSAPQQASPTQPTAPYQGYGAGWGCRGMRGWAVSNVPASGASLNLTAAATVAQQYLDIYQPGATVGNAATFGNCYVFDVLNNAFVEGTLCVNAYTGQVSQQNWCGACPQGITP